MADRSKRKYINTYSTKINKEQNNATCFQIISNIKNKVNNENWAKFYFVYFI